MNKEKVNVLATYFLPYYHSVCLSDSLYYYKQSSATVGVLTALFGVVLVFSKPWAEHYFESQIILQIYNILYFIKSSKFNSF